MFKKGFRVSGIYQPNLYYWHYYYMPTKETFEAARKLLRDCQLCIPEIKWKIIQVV